MDLQSLLQKKFGFEQFRPGQEAIVRDVLKGKDTLAILPTGMGKSLCYQLPAYALEGAVLIISPLVALMEDQVAVMKKSGEKRVVALNSFLSFSDKNRILSSLASYKFIFISPEMLTQESIVSVLQRMHLGLLVVDEAHCISQWGFDFRPDYLRIGNFFEKVQRPNILALTATADDKVVEDIRFYLQLKSAVVHRQPIDRTNISYTIIKVNSQIDKTEWIKDRLQSTIGPGIIYVASRKRADELSEYLRREGIQIASYHAGMEQEDRALIQEQFVVGELNWICATNAFGMGIHKDNVRQIIHEHMPQSIASYSQEVGRAGRDQLQATACLLYSPEDDRRIRFITQEEMPQELEILHYYNLMQTGTTSIDAAELSSLSETGRRMIDYYLESEKVEDVIHQIEQLKKDKEEQLQKMLQLVHSGNCIRKELLSVFGEKLSTTPQICCSICGLENEAWLQNREMINDNEFELDWKTRLDLLLSEN